MRPVGTLYVQSEALKMIFSLRTCAFKMYMSRLVYIYVHNIRTGLAYLYVLDICKKVYAREAIRAHTVEKNHLKGFTVYIGAC